MCVFVWNDDFESKFSLNKTNSIIILNDCEKMKNQFEQNKAENSGSGIANFAAFFPGSFCCFWWIGGNDHEKRHAHCIND